MFAKCLWLFSVLIISGGVSALPQQTASSVEDLDGVVVIRNVDYLAALMALDPSYLAAHGLAHNTIRGTIPISPFLYVEETAKDRPKTVWGEDPEAWLEASVTPHVGPNKGPMLLIYADGDDKWRRDQIDIFGEAMRAAGNRRVRVVEMPDRTHGSLMTSMNAPDDRIGDQVMEFVKMYIP